MPRKNDIFLVEGFWNGNPDDRFSIVAKVTSARNGYVCLHVLARDDEYARLADPHTVLMPRWTVTQHEWRTQVKPRRLKKEDLLLFLSYPYKNGLAEEIKGRKA